MHFWRSNWEFIYFSLVNILLVGLFIRCRSRHYSPFHFVLRQSNSSSRKYSILSFDIDAVCTSLGRFMHYCILQGLMPCLVVETLCLERQPHQSTLCILPQLRHVGHRLDPPERRRIQTPGRHLGLVLLWCCRGTPVTGLRRSSWRGGGRSAAVRRERWRWGHPRCEERGKYPVSPRLQGPATIDAEIYYGAI